MAGRNRAAVLGSPIAHSLSPALHRAAYRALGLAWTYDAIDVDEAALPAFLDGLDDTWAGLSLTMPLKEAVIPLLAEVDPEARSLRSVNTVLPLDRGWRGTNTDVYGMTQALTEAGLDATPRHAVVLGAGATARSALAALLRLGAGEVVVAARRPEAADALCDLGRSLGLRMHTTDLDPDPQLVRVDVVVSTLPGAAAEPWAGMVGDAPGVLLDASYHPWPTPLAANWGSGRIASGRDMLLWQAVEQVRLMTGLEPDVAAMAAALPD
ncbi:MAG: shikimate dehydrogenase [Actinomycetales bacterium]|nr:shikimate dehydrogenase [Actinomycetales bacterium]